MAKLSILTEPNTMLGMKSKIVTEFGARLHQLIDDMTETMIACGNGLGLSAVQIGVLYRVCVIDNMEGNIMEFINPIIKKAKKFVEGEEGCLSCPGVQRTFKRAQKVTVEAQDREGKHFEKELEGILAICIQHEIDHMDGKIFSEGGV